MKQRYSRACYRQISLFRIEIVSFQIKGALAQFENNENDDDDDNTLKKLK